MPVFVEWNFCVDDSEESMQIQALSVVAPWGQYIAERRKTIEVRSWKPDSVPIERLLIVENNRRLTQPDDIDPDGRGVAIARIADVHDWTPEEAQAACSVWEAGWFAWIIEEVYPIAVPFRVIAARRIYEVDIDDNMLRS